MDNILLTDDEDIELSGIDLSGLTKEQKQQIYHKRYYDKNKEKISLAKSITLHCECGGHFPKQQKARHIKGYVHRTFMLNKSSTTQSNLI